MKFVALIVITLVFANVQAGELDTAEQKIKEGLQLILPDVEITRVRHAPIPGMYEVVLGPEVIYITGDARYVLRGELLDLGERRNVTESTRAENRRAVLAKVSQTDMIEFSNGNPKHVIYIFTDPDCGFCRKLHQDVPYLTEQGVAIRYLAYPRAGVGSSTYNKMVSVWCAKDQQAAMDKAKAGQAVEERQCNNPVEAQLKTGQMIGIRGTPAIILEDGQQLPGYVEPNELLAILNSGR